MNSMNAIGIMLAVLGARFATVIPACALIAETMRSEGS